jgi:transcriptional regulator with XRE-family HTH domain
VKKYTRDTEGIQTFGTRLRELRKQKGMSQEQLAFAADVELSQISRIERGVINTSLSQIFQIARALNIHPKELFDFSFSNIKEQ